MVGMEAAVTDTKMTIEVPAQLREMAVKSVDTAEAAINSFLESASRSVQVVPAPMGDVAKQALSISEKNLKAAFDHARKLMQAEDLSEVMRLQTEFVRSQYSVAAQQFQQLAGAASGSKDTSESV